MIPAVGIVGKVQDLESIMSRLLMIPLDQIRTNPVALRDVDRKGEGFQQLVDSVRLQGVINAISVREKRLPGEADDGKQYELIDGLQRFTASVEVGSGVKGQVGLIPAQILDQTDEEALETQIIGNAHRVETKPVEYAKAMMRILSFNPTWTEAELAAKLAKSPQWIAKQLGLLKLADPIKALVDDNKIPLANAYVLAKLEHDEQANWLDRAMTMPASEFGPACLARAKEIRDANRKGENAAPEEFIPVAHLRKKTEIEETLKVGVTPVVEALLPVAENVTDEGSFRTGFELGLKWALNLDPKSLEDAKAKYEADRKQKAEEKEKREKEKKEKRAKELAEKAKLAEEEAAKVREQVAQA